MSELAATKEQLKVAEALADVPASELAPIGAASDTGAPPLLADIDPEELDDAKAERLPVEEWGKRAGYLPQFWKSKADFRSGRLRAVAPLTNPKYWIFAGAKAYHQWPEQLELSKAQFDHAVALAHSHPIR